MTVWGRAGRRGPSFLPWFEIRRRRGNWLVGAARLTGGISRRGVAGVLRATYPDASPTPIANDTGRGPISNLIALGDLVVVPLKASRSFRAGRIVGPAEHRKHLAEMAAVRPVEWEAELASRPWPLIYTQCTRLDHDRVQATSAGDRTTA